MQSDVQHIPVADTARLISTALARVPRIAPGLVGKIPSELIPADIPRPRAELPASSRRQSLRAPNAFYRVDDIKTRPNALKQIRIPRPVDGARLVAQLKSAATEGSVTEYRREQKAPVSRQQFETVLNALSREGITFEPREVKASKCEEQADPLRFRGTLTYYGKAAVFNNHDDRTKIRMRIRYYVEGTTDAQTGKVSTVKRAKITGTVGFVELKIKNPRPGESGFVDKYRMILPDRLVYQLINLDPKSETFNADVERLQSRILALNSPENERNKPHRVKAMMAVISQLAKRDAAFVKPHLVITYARDGYAFKENYHIAEYQPKKGLGCFNCLGSAREAVPKIQPIEYQLTVDRNISAHLPLLPLREDAPVPVAAHFNPQNKTELLRYPEEIRVLEFKQPKPMALLPTSLQSQVQQKFSSTLIHSLKMHRTWGDFATQTGKYGTFRAHLKGTFEPPVLERVPYEISEATELPNSFRWTHDANAQCLAALLEPIKEDVFEEESHP